MEYTYSVQIVAGITTHFVGDFLYKVKQYQYPDVKVLELCLIPDQNSLSPVDNHFAFVVFGHQHFGREDKNF